MNLCRNGHDKDVVGINVRTDKGKRVERCAQCVADYRARELAMRKERRAANPKRPRTRQTPEERRARRKARAQELRRERGIQAREAKRDGFEDEYGPIPKPIPNRDWFDWVVVARMLAGIPIGRYPTKPEWAEFFDRNKTTTLMELENATGMTQTSIWTHARENGYAWPYELTAHARSRKE